MKNIKPAKLIRPNRITLYRIFGYAVMLAGPILFFYKQPNNTVFSLFIEALLVLFGLVVLKDCWVSQLYWQTQSEKNTEKASD